MIEIDKILEENYSEEFDQLSKNRVLTSFYKYGPAKVNFGQRLVNAIESAEMCIKKYRETGNTEYLVDAKNYLMFEFKFPQHPKAYFKATSSDESAGISGMSIKEIERIAKP